MTERATGYAKSAAMYAKNARHAVASARKAIRNGSSLECIERSIFAAVQYVEYAKTASENAECAYRAAVDAGDSYADRRASGTVKMLGVAFTRRQASSYLFAALHHCHNHAD